MAKRSKPARPSTQLLDYLRLMRIPNVFTAIADTMMGFLVVRQSLSPLVAFLFLAGATSLLYIAGMILNDFYDVEIDRRERPFRPLASQRISLTVAQRLGFGLLAGGVLLGIAAGFASLPGNSLVWRSGLLAALLACSVWMYDAFAKKTPCGPLVMGACRFLNILMAMSIAAPLPDGWQFGGFGFPHFCVAAGIGVYTMGLTWFARGETATGHRGRLAWGAGVMMAGVALLALLPEDYRSSLPGSRWLLTLVFLSFWIARRLVVTILDPQPDRVQAAVKHGILSLIILDAAIVLAATSDFRWPIATLLLLVPTLMLGKWIYST